MKTVLTGILGVAFAAISMTAQANLITITGTTATVDCTAGASSPACQGFTGGDPSPATTGPNRGQPTTMGTLSTTMAEIYRIIGSEQAETNALNTLAGTTFLATDAIQTDTAGVDSFSFSTNALYFSIKTGLGTSFFRNEAGLTTLNVLYDRNNTQGGGIGHITEFGRTVTNVPEPAPLVLLGLAMLGLALVSARRGQAS